MLSHFILSVLFNLTYPNHTQSIPYFSLIVEQKESKIAVSIKPEPFLEESFVLAFEKSFPSKPDHYNLFQFNEITGLLKDLESQRTLLAELQILDENSRPLKLINVSYSILIHSLKGKLLDRKIYNVGIGLSEIPGKAFMVSDLGFMQFPICDLEDPIRFFSHFLRHLTLPNSIEFEIPDENEWIVDLFASLPIPLKWGRIRHIKDHFPSPLWEKRDDDLLSFHRASTYVHREGDDLKTCPSEADRRLGTILNAYQAEWDAESSDKKIEACMEYLQVVPNDKWALTQTLRGLMTLQREGDAKNLFDSLNPLLPSLDSQKWESEIRSALHQKRSLLMNKINTLKINQEASISVKSPQVNDVLSGQTHLNIHINASQNALIGTYCHLGNTFLTSFFGNEYLSQFDAPPEPSEQSLTVTAFFQDGTYLQSQIPFQTLAVSEEAGVHIVPLRAVVVKGIGEFLTDLTRDDFKIKESGIEQVISTFRRDQASLNIALLMDTSGSLLGQKLIQEKYAFTSFIRNLMPEDQVSLFTFDTRVRRLFPFQSFHMQMIDVLATARCQGTTYLYDAIYAASETLTHQKGIRDIREVYDGVDTGSILLPELLLNYLTEHNIMVYSVIPSVKKTRNLAFNKDVEKGQRYLEKLSAHTGSASYRITSYSNIEHAFAQIYQELKSFYYMEYVSPQRHTTSNSIKISIERWGAKPRFFRLTPSKSF